MLASKTKVAWSVLFTFAKRMEHNRDHWSNGLLASMTNPENIVDSDEKLVIIKDKYPKAKYHFLVLPRQKISSLNNVTKKDLDLLHHMHKKGIDFAGRVNKELKFRFGYHAIPSMSQLHMHVISQDFNSPYLKTKKHWNSFTTAYFVDSEELIKKIEKSGHWTTNEEEMKQYLLQKLRCNVCQKDFTSIPALKAHIVLHDVTIDASS